LLRQAGKRIESAQGVGLDPGFALTAKELWSEHGLEVAENDFADWGSQSSYEANLIVANPPYVRHLHRTTKKSPAPRFPPTIWQVRHKRFLTAIWRVTETPGTDRGSSGLAPIQRISELPDGFMAVGCTS
jgi:hypothetical protein